MHISHFTFQIGYFFRSAEKLDGYRFLRSTEFVITTTTISLCPCCR